MRRRLVTAILLAQSAAEMMTPATTLSRAFLAVVRNNNNAAAAAASARSFVVDGAAVGRVLARPAAALARYPHVFDVTAEAVTLKAEAGTTMEARTAAVGAVMTSLREERSIPLLDGWRDEPYAVRSSFFAEPALIVERAAAPLLGAPAYGVFVTGYTAGADDVPRALWIGRRSSTKPTWPGLLDCLAAGGMAAGELPVQAVRKEAAEEAGVPPSLADHIRPSGGVAYTGFDETGWALKRDVLYAFELRCPETFAPVPTDGEVEEFTLVPIDEACALLRRQAAGEAVFKPNVAVVSSPAP